MMRDVGFKPIDDLEIQSEYPVVSNLKGFLVCRYKYGEHMHQFCTNFNSVLLPAHLCCMSSLSTLTI